MIVTKETYVDLQEKYDKVKKLIEEDSKHDPQNEPYLSKYAARQILLGMKANVENLLKSQTPETDEYFKLTGILGLVLLHLCTISVDTDEFSAGLNYAILCRQIVKNQELRPELVLVSLNVLNELGLLWSEKDPEMGKSYLEEAESFYKVIKTDKLKAINVQTLLSGDLTYENENGDSQSDLTGIEKLHTLTLYYLAQVYSALKEPMKSAIYCHNTLKRQLQSEDYDAVEWALNAATLSQFFIENNGFKQARNHLAVSSYVLNLYEKRLREEEDSSEESQAKWEVYRNRSADIARCWVKYGLLLLGNSRDRLLKASEDIDSPCSLVTDLSNLKLESNFSISSSDLANLYFPGLDLDGYEQQVSDQFVLTIEDAYKVFLNAKTWLDKAQTYYTIDNLASDYIELALDKVQLYLNLSFFEENIENRAKMHKRRVDLLESVLDQVNPTYYMQYCKKMWYELAQAYGEILDIKLDKLKELRSRPTPHALSKVNSLVEKTVKQYTNFIDSFRDTERKELPKKIEKDYEKPFLLAYFQIGALHSRYVSLDKRINLEHVKASLEAYNRVVTYCRENPEVQDVIKSEVSICKEMVTLLPIKILKLTQEVG